MVDLNPLERLLEGPPPVPCSASEQDYFAAWQAHGLERVAPVVAAIDGALLADRLAWVFAAGYQATLRNAFPMLPAAGWAAFVATEETREPERYPGTTLGVADDGGLCLDGYKLWVGHSRVAAHLVVTVNDPAGDKRRARAVIVPRAAPGVNLSHREMPGFLPAISQGYARFERTPVAADDVTDFEPLRQFGRTEAKFVMLAATAFMLVRLPAGNARDDGLAVAAALIALIHERDTSRQVYGAVDRAFQALADTFVSTFDTTALPGDAEDLRLLRMYSARIQRRVGYAVAEARERGG